MTATAYPVRLEFQGDRHIHRVRPLVQWLLVIPQALVASALGSLRGVLTFVSFFYVLVTRAIPRPLFDLIAMTYRYEWRVNSYALFMREDYPPFDFSMDEEGRSSDHARLSVTYPEELNRWMPLVKWFLAIPHVIVPVALTIGAVVAIVAGFFAVLFTGEYPEGIRDYLVGFYRWRVRVEMYVGLLTDVYPPFSLA